MDLVLHRNSLSGLNTRLSKRGYNPSGIYSSNPRLRRVIDSLNAGFAGQSFEDIASYLTTGINFIADPYMCLRDYDDYMRAYNDMNEAYKDKTRWNKMALVNIAKSGVFAADRAIDEYAANIWNLTKVEE